MSVASQAFFPAVPVSGLDGYIHYVNQIPMLSADEELAFAREFR